MFPSREWRPLVVFFTPEVDGGNGVIPIERQFQSSLIRGLKRWLRGPMLVALALAPAAAAPAGGQTNVVLSGPATCRQCRIELEQVVAFGDSTGPGMLQEQSVIAADQRGRFYVTSAYDPTIAVFDARGRFLHRIGRKGQGPGEFTRRPTMLFGPGDTLYALEGSTRRMTVFSPQYELVRTGTLGLSYSTAVRLPNGRFLLSGVSRSAEAIGYPLHLLDQNGAYIRSFGSATGAQDLFASTSGTVRRFAAPVGETVWTVRADELVLERWSADGKKLAHTTRQAPWFPNSHLPPNANPGTHPDPPVVRSLSEDKAGLLWILTRVQDREWRPRTLPAHRDGTGPYVPDSLRHKLNDSVLEVIDPARGAVLATRTFDSLFMGFIAPNLLVSFDEDADGNPRYVVWRARLISPR